MKSVSTMEARTINGGAITGKVSATCSYCKHTYSTRWWLTQSSKNTAIVLVNGKARKCYYSHL
ncbi:MAG: hypothetical protein PUF84_00345 [Ruminococcus bromii]|nr:hypothetical protein [Ruminococcus bromii]MDD6433052.1 hypothetical protein [Ruminococcus bromii]MDY4711063.1 hypothetical protein [Ruminococcus bromii]